MWEEESRMGINDVCKLGDSSGVHCLMHCCNPLATTKDDTAATFACKPDAVSGTSQCYFGQLEPAAYVTSHPYSYHAKVTRVSCEHALGLS